MKALLKYYVHSQLLIASCAGMMYVMSSHVLQGSIDLGITLFIGSSTFLLYNAHRLIGKSLLGSKLTARRFEHFSDFRAHFFVYLAIALSYSLYFVYTNTVFFFNLKLILVPVIFSALYITPIFRGKRLRDFAIIKIFVIAIVWAWVTVFWIDDIIVLNSKQGLVLIIERLLFTFAITLPFDIRDEQIDQQSGVVTLVHLMGTSRSKLIAIASLFLPFVLMLCVVGSVNLSYLMAYAITGVVASVLIWKSDIKKEEEYFGGYIDGLMLLFPALYFVFIWL